MVRGYFYSFDIPTLCEGTKLMFGWNPSTNRRVLFNAEDYFPEQDTLHCKHVHMRRGRHISSYLVIYSDELRYIMNNTVVSDFIGSALICRLDSRNLRREVDMSPTNGKRVARDLAMQYVPHTCSSTSLIAHIQSRPRPGTRVSGIHPRDYRLVFAIVFADAVADAVAPTHVRLILRRLTYAHTTQVRN